MLEKIQSRSKIQVELNLVSDLHVGAGVRADSTAMLPVVRRPSGQGMEFYIPGSALKGKLRHECTRLLKGLEVPNAEKVISGIFGSGGGGPEKQSKLRFMDSSGVQLKAPKIRYHASINKKGAAETFFSEEAIPEGSRVEFEIRGKNLKQWEVGVIVAGLQSLCDHYLGGGGSRGYGEFEISSICSDIGGQRVEKAALLGGLRSHLVEIGGKIA